MALTIVAVMHEDSPLYTLALISMIWQGVVALAIVSMLGIVSLHIRRMDNSIRIQIDHLGDVKQAVEGVHKATNSLVQQLVQSTQSEALIRGGIEERERAEKADRERYLGETSNPEEKV